MNTAARSAVIDKLSLVLSRFYFARNARERKSVASYAAEGINVGDEKQNSGLTKSLYRNSHKALRYAAR